MSSSQGDAAEIDALDEAETLLTDGEFSEVFSSQVLVDVSFLSEQVVFQIKLGLEGLSVSISLGDEGSQFLDFVLNCSEVNGDGGDGSLEFGVFGIQGINSLFESNNVFSFGGSEGVQGIDDGVSEFVELGDDFSE